MDIHFIDLANGLISVVDKEDKDKVSQWTWNPNKMDSGLWRVAHNGKKCGYNYLHQYIMGSINVDHINGDPLDNRKANLRLATLTENRRNVGKINKVTSSHYKGVSLCKQTGLWEANVRELGRKVRLGRFKSEALAALAYNEASLRIYGEFASPNSVEVI